MYIYNENNDNLKVYWTHQSELIAAGKTEVTVKDNNGFFEGYIYK